MDYSNRWGIIKTGFTKKAGDVIAPQNASHVSRHEGEKWQRLFWEHQIRNEKNYQAHCDYIHYNPVNHGLVKEPGEWRYSSFHRFVQDGFYDAAWGSHNEVTFSADV